MPNLLGDAIAIGNSGPFVVFAADLGKALVTHIIHFTATDEAPTRDVADELRGLLTSCTLAVARHFAQPSLDRSALVLKRERVALPEFRGYWFATGRGEERLGELINVLATVARTVDALDYFAQRVGGTVIKCNPSTSNLGHDIEILADGTHLIVEVSDVAGHGNANNKMTKDLTTLLEATAGAKLLLAVSERSGRWLTSSSIPERLGANCRLVAEVPPDRHLPTWIVAVDRASPGTADSGAE